MISCVSGGTHVDGYSLRLHWLSRIFIFLAQWVFLLARKKSVWKCQEWRCFWSYFSVFLHVPSSVKIWISLQFWMISRNESCRMNLISIVTLKGYILGLKSSPSQSWPVKALGWDPWTRESFVLAVVTEIGSIKEYEFAKSFSTNQHEGGGVVVHDRWHVQKNHICTAASPKVSKRLPSQSFTVESWNMASLCKFGDATNLEKYPFRLYNIIIHMV